MTNVLEHDPQLYMYLFYFVKNNVAGMPASDQFHDFFSVTQMHRMMTLMQGGRDLTYF